MKRRAIPNIGVSGPLLLLAMSGACAAQKPPECAQSIRVDLSPVPYPPPAALPEVVPAAPEDTLWVDGQWRWNGRRWVWERGAWVRVPSNACRVESVLIFNPDGSIAYTPGFWVVEGGQRVAPDTVRPAGYPPRRKTPERSPPSG